MLEAAKLKVVISEYLDTLVTFQLVNKKTNELSQLGEHILNSLLMYINVKYYNMQKTCIYNRQIGSEITKNKFNNGLEN